MPYNRPHSKVEIDVAAFTWATRGLSTEKDWAEWAKEFVYAVATGACDENSQIHKYTSVRLLNSSAVMRAKRLKDAKGKGKHTKTQWEALKLEFNGVCVRCQIPGGKIQKDHILPIYLGGSDSIENIQPLCVRCNCQKGPEDFNWKEYRRANNGKD